MGTKRTIQRRMQKANNRRLTVWMPWPLHERFLALCKEMETTPDQAATTLFVEALNSFFEAREDKKNKVAPRVHVVSPEVFTKL